MDLKAITKILNVIYSIIVLFFFMDNLTCFDVKNQLLKSFIYFGVLIGTPLTLIWNIIVIKTKAVRMIGAIFPLIILIYILNVGFLKILFAKGAWNTQSILFENSHLNFKTIEFQMQDVGAFGYNQRIVEVFYFTPFFMITNEVQIDKEIGVEWVKVDKEVNELGLKFP